MASDALQTAALAAILEAYMATLVAPVVRLFTDNVIITPDTDLSALTQPSGDWYAEQALTFGEVFELPGGSIAVQAESVQFNYSGTDPAETIRGWMVVDPGSPDTYVSARRLPADVLMENSLSSCIATPGWVIPTVLAS